MDIQHLFFEDRLPFQFELCKKDAQSINSVQEEQMTPPLMELEEFQICHEDLAGQEQPRRVQRPQQPIRKEKTKESSRYDKNICGYILKKVVREFVGDKYTERVTALCADNSCDVSEAKAFYLKRVECIYGVSHLRLLTVPETRADINIKKTFLDFTEWFLKERYLRHLLEEGRMERKKSYIQFKNRYFPTALAACRAELEQFSATFATEDCLLNCIDSFQQTSILS